MAVTGFALLSSGSPTQSLNQPSYLATSNWHSILSYPTKTRYVESNLDNWYGFENFTFDYAALSKSTLIAKSNNKSPIQVCIYWRQPMPFSMVAVTRSKQDLRPISPRGFYALEVTPSSGEQQELHDSCWPAQRPASPGLGGSPPLSHRSSLPAAHCGAPAYAANTPPRDHEQFNTDSRQMGGSSKAVKHDAALYCGNQQ